MIPGFRQTKVAQYVALILQRMTYKPKRVNLASADQQDIIDHGVTEVGVTALAGLLIWMFWISANVLASAATVLQERNRGSSGQGGALAFAARTIDHHATVANWVDVVMLANLRSQSPSEGMVCDSARTVNPMNLQARCKDRRPWSTMSPSYTPVTRQSCRPF